MNAKLGSCVVLRRGTKGYSLLAWLVHSSQILRVLSGVLSDLLNHYQVKMGKMTTKPAKIRRLLSLPEVVENCTEAEIKAVESALQEQENKKLANKNEETEEAAEQLDENQDNCISMFFYPPHVFIS